MKVSELRNYGVPFSDAEASWPDDVKKRMKKVGMKVVMGKLGALEKLRFLFAFLAEKRRVERVDLSALRARGLTNERFLAQQLEYLAMFCALERVVGPARALEIGLALMDATAREPLLLTMPELDDVRRFDDPLQVFREYFRVGNAASAKNCCHDVTIAEDSADACQFDITWCAWLELARLVGAPQACIPNCYADDLAFPEYFAALGIRYTRTGTLAKGARCCDTRLERIKP
jgi:hypothetical protein